jgi:beta-N-acetylhexosaminidase
MKKKLKTVLLSSLAIGLVVSQLFVGTTTASGEVDEASNVTDLIIYQNVPQVNPEIKDNQIDLKALHVYDEGQFLLTTTDLEWGSTNKTVATVDEDGTVTFTGENGRTFITVTDGEFTDQIALDHKPIADRQSNGKPDFVPNVVKQTGDRYDVISKAIAKMTINEKIGQMLMPDYRNWNGKNVTELLPEIEQQVKDYHLGGVILFRENVVTTEQTAKLVSQYKEATDKYGLLLSIDQEGGIVTRLQSGTDLPGNMAIGATRSTEIAHNVGKAIGEELAALGINMNLAPVLDVNNNPDNPVIGVRSFGSDPELVGDMGVAYVEGLQSTGVAGTAKHFPGHGDTAVDSHLGLPEVPHDKERLLEVELYPFQRAMDAGIDAVMTAHVTFPKIDNTKVISKKDGKEIAIPATLSEKVLTGLMRDEMGYDGLIITDALNMKAIADHFGPVDAAIRAVKAGTDIVLMPIGLEAVANGLLEAVESGEITESRIEASVERILTLKVKRGIIKEETPQPIDEKIANAIEVVGSDAHKQVEKEAAERSVTLVKNEAVLPLNVNDEDKIVVIGGSFSSSIHSAVSAYHENTVYINKSTLLTEEQLAEIADASAVIVSTYSYSNWTKSPSHPQMQMVNQIIEATDAPVIGLGIRNPYDIMAYPDVDAYLAQYGFRTASFEATAATIFGENNPTGLLPVDLPGFYGFGHGLSY